MGTADEDMPFEQQVETLAELLLRAAEAVGVVFSPWHPAAVPAGDGADRRGAAGRQARQVL
jgi:hypothetical protein